MGAIQAQRDPCSIADREIIQCKSGHCTITWGAKPTLDDLKFLRKYINLRIKWDESDHPPEVNGHIPTPTPDRKDQQ